VDAYRNRIVIEKFLERYDVSRRGALVLFREMKRWLWLNARANARPDAPELYVNDRLLPIDMMWHTFVLFTKDYAAFCEHYFGHFIHHVPSTYLEKRALRRLMALPREDPRRRRFLAREKRRAIAVHEFIVQELGQKTFALWFKRLPKHYTAELMTARFTRGA
jgi:hypothetical protein